MIKTILGYSLFVVSATLSAQIAPEDNNPGGGMQNMSNPGGEPGQLNTIVFEYDNMGNQTKRTFIYLANRPAGNAPQTESARGKIEYTATETYADISYYPNPLHSELYLKWTNTQQVKVTAIELYDLTGKTLKKYNGLENNENLVMNFSDYPSGIFTVLVLYNDGKTKDLKIVKQ